MAFNAVGGIAQVNGRPGPYDNRVKNPNVRYGRNAVANYAEYNARLSLPADQFDAPDVNALAGDLADSLQVAKRISTTKILQAYGIINPKFADVILKRDEGRLAQQNESTGQRLDQLEGWTNEQHNIIENAAPIGFKLQYLPEDKVTPKNLNKLALMAASFEDLGKKISIPVVQITQGLQQIFGKKVSAEALDANNDGQIDIAENATSILIKDMADKHSTDDVVATGKLDLQAKDIDGTYTNTGETNIWSFLKTDKISETKQLITQIYNAFQLDKAKEEFLSDENNTIQ